MKNRKLDELYPLPPESFSKRIADTLETLPERTEHDETKERNTVKKSFFTWKKALAFAAAALLLTGAVFAGGARTKSSRIGWSSSGYTYKSYEKMPQDERFEKKFGFDLGYEIPESFSNGYTFDGATKVNNYDVYDDGTDSPLFYGIDITYKNGDREITLNIEKEYEDDMSYSQYLKGDKATFAETYDGTDIYKSEQIMLLVPEDYVMTDEDKVLEEEGTYFFSSVNKENFEGENARPVKTEINCTSAMWNADGISYRLFVFGVNDISSDELVEMAKEIISAKK